MVKEISNPIMDQIIRKTSFLSKTNLSDNQYDSFNTEDDFVMSNENNRNMVVSSAG